VGLHKICRRPETGEAIWAYQINPHDDHDYDGVNENILLDLMINGRRFLTVSVLMPVRVLKRVDA
jgi:glucose dehydrogenase